MKRDYLEEDMYESIKYYFTNLGYVCHGEVKSCDMTAQKDDKLIILEFKKSLSIELLIQATKRQKISDLTYLCVPRPKKFRYNSKFYDLLFLLKRLSLGLIFVSIDENGKDNSIDIILEPKEIDMKRVKSSNKKHRRSLEKELFKRVTSINKGGSTRKKIMTSYKEDSLRLLYLASLNNFIAPKDGVLFGVKKSQNILKNNYYDWFVNIERGKYKITQTGLKALDEFDEVIKLLIQTQD